MQTLNKVHPILSDLFFNFSHEHYDALYEEAYNNDRQVTREEEEQAIGEDALEFLNNYGEILPACTPAELGADFLARV